MQKFKDPYNINYRSNHGEPREADAAEINDLIENNTTNKLNESALSGIFNEGETGLFLQMLPSKAKEISD